MRSGEKEKNQGQMRPPKSEGVISSAVCTPKAAECCLASSSFLNQPRQPFIASLTSLPPTSLISAYLIVLVPRYALLDQGSLKDPERYRNFRRFLFGQTVPSDDTLFALFSADCF